MLGVERGGEVGEGPLPGPDSLLWKNGKQSGRSKEVKEDRYPGSDTSGVLETVPKDEKAAPKKTVT